MFRKPMGAMLTNWFIDGSKILHRNEVDVALVNGVIPIRFKPKIAVAHGPILNVSFLRNTALKKIYKTYDKVICISKKGKYIYRNIFNCKEIIPLPLKLDLFNATSEKEDFIVHIGTRSVKNPNISIKTIEILREKGFKIDLYIIGGYSEYIRRYAKNRNYIKLFHNISEKKKLDILSKAKALILPSSAETFSLTVMESMASGTPPVVSTEVPEDVVINGFNGFRIDSYNPTDYAYFLEKLLEGRRLWNKIRENGLSFVKKFDHVVIAKNYVKMMEDFRK